MWSVQSKLVENFCGDWSDRRKFRTRTVEIVESFSRYAGENRRSDVCLWPRADVSSCTAHVRFRG